MNALAFESQIKHLNGIQKNRQGIILNFNLENKPTELEEVVITKEVPIRIKNDTTTYNPESFKDGTERVVEDLLKKLPGIKVEENGEIKFKGKSIKKFLLDGDDLFNSQYTTGSKNLSVDMVEKVQAIENFNENAMLKGLVNAEDVAINILLKKGKTDLSGDAFFSYGIQDRYNVSMTGLFVNKKTKGFLTTAYNNIGNNYSPYDFSSEITSLSQKSEKEEQTKKKPLGGTLDGLHDFRTGSAYVCRMHGLLHLGDGMAGAGEADGLSEHSNGRFHFLSHAKCHVEP